MTTTELQYRDPLGRVGDESMVQRLEEATALSRMLWNELEEQESTPDQLRCGRLLCGMLTELLPQVKARLGWEVK